MDLDPDPTFHFDTDPDPDPDMDPPPSVDMLENQNLFTLYSAVPVYTLLRILSASYVS